MEIIALTASEEKLFENVDGRTSDACIYEGCPESFETVPIS